MVRLIKSMENHYKAWKKAFLEHNINLKKDQYYHLEGSKLLEIAKKILKENNRPSKLASNIVIKKEYYYNADNRIDFYKDVIKIVNRLKDIYSLGIVTAAKRKTFESTIPTNFKKKFNVIITGDETKKGKPSPEPYLLAAKKLNKKKSNCIVVENAPLGILSAKKAGMFCIAISSTVSKLHLYKADIIIDKFNEILKLNVINQS